MIFSTIPLIAKINEEGFNFPGTCLFIDNGAELNTTWPSDNTVVNGDEYTQFDYINGLFGNDVWQGVRFILGPNFNITRYSRLEKIFPGLEIIPLPIAKDGIYPVYLENGQETGQAIHCASLSAGLSLLSTIRSDATGYEGSGSMYGNSSFSSFSFIIFPSSYIVDGKIQLPPPSYTSSADSEGNKFVAIPGYIYEVTITFTGGSTNPRVSYGTYHHSNKGNERFNIPDGFAPVIMSETWYNILNGREVGTIENDPYSPGGNSQGGGGGGSFDGSSVSINHPAPPSIQASDTGFLTLYSPSIPQVKAMADYMWSDGFSLDDFKKLFADPMQAILSFHAVPVPVVKGNPKKVKLGNIDTGVDMPPVSNQWVTVDCGSLTLSEFWGAYLDYNPYTRLQLYLPYIGVVTVSADDVIGKALSLHYNVDVLSGACVATLMCAGTVLYNWQGAVAMQIPFTTLTYGNLLGSVLSVAGAGLGLAASAIASGGVSLGAAIGVAGAAGAAAVNSQKENIGHGGGVSGTAGFMGIQTPYFILSRPSLCLPENQNDFIGYPSFTTVKLSSLSGFTRIHEIHLEYIAATKDELTELEGLLKEGVLF